MKFQGRRRGKKRFAGKENEKEGVCREGEGERSGLQGRRVRRKEFAGKEKEKEDVYR